MSNYIALRGKLEWVTGQEDATTVEASSAPSSTNALKPISSTDGSYWQWTGVWAFGDRIVVADDPVAPSAGAAEAGGTVTPTNSTTKKKAAQIQQPFRYTWDAKAFPSDVLVPSIVQPTIEPSSTEENQNQDEQKEEKPSPMEVDGVTTSESITKETKAMDEMTEALEQTPKTDKEVEALAGSADDKVKIEPATDAAEKSDEATAPKGDSNEVSKQEKPADDNTRQETPEGTNQTQASDKSAIEDASDRASSVGQEEKKDPSLDNKDEEPETMQPITFATVDEGDPPFTDAIERFGSAEASADASENRNAKCPASGKWVGYFQNATGRNRDRIHRVQEQFYLFLNATPGPNARSEFFDYDETNEEEKDCEDANKESERKIPPGNVHVRGMGENQFGTFELVGVLDLETMMLQIQRKYVYVEPSPSPSRRRASSSASTLTPNSTVVTRHQSNRPYSTRKRQPSWKRKAVYGDEGDSESSSSTPNVQGKRKRRQKSSPPGTSPLMATSPSLALAGATLISGDNTITGVPPLGTGISQPGVSGAVAGIAAPLYAGQTPHVAILPNPALSGTTIPGLAHAASGSFAIPGTGAGGVGQVLSPAILTSVPAAGMALPSTAGTNRKRSSSTSKSGSSKHVKRQSNSNAAGLMPSTPASVQVSSTVTTTTTTYTSSSLTGSNYLKLPPVGDPKKARWRAAHFLYYQRHDPTDETQQGTPNSNSGGANNSSSNLIRTPSYASSTAAAAAAASTSLYGSTASQNQSNNASTGGNSSSKSAGGSGGVSASNNATTTPTSHSGLPSNPRYVVYEGEMLDGKRDGRGICLYSNGMLYEGTWKKDKEHGKGKLMTADRQRIIYEGDFEKGRMQGVGTYYYAQAENSLSSPPSLTTSALTTKGTAGSSGASASRKRKSDSKSGGGDSTAANGEDGVKVEDAGSRYYGDFKENMRNGFGTYIFPDGSIYVGLWRDGLMNGRGAFTWPDDSYYDGEWKDGKR